MGAYLAASSEWTRVSEQCSKDQPRLEEVLHARRRQGLSSLESLVAFLEAELGAVGDVPARMRPKEEL